MRGHGSGYLIRLPQVRVGVYAESFSKRADFLQVGAEFMFIKCLLSTGKPSEKGQVMGEQVDGNIPSAVYLLLPNHFLPHLCLCPETTVQERDEDALLSGGQGCRGAGENRSMFVLSLFLVI